MAIKIRNARWCNTIKKPRLDAVLRTLSLTEEIFFIWHLLDLD